MIFSTAPLLPSVGAMTLIATLCSEASNQGLLAIRKVRLYLLAMYCYIN